MISNSITIFDASAGAGKTYALTKAYLSILLSSAEDDAYKKILAITFTNKAVEEMKSRVVYYLFEFSKPILEDKALVMAKSIANEQNIFIKSIQKKSYRIVKNLIHNYTSFDISTIDAFTHKLVRSFTNELNLPSNFEITLDTHSLLQEAVEMVINKAGEDDEITKYLIEFTKMRTDADKNWDITNDLYQVAQLLVNENTLIKIESLKSKNLNDFKEIKENIQIRIEELKETIASESLAIFKSIKDDAFISEAIHKDLHNHFEILLNFKLLKQKRYDTIELLREKIKKGFTENQTILALTEQWHYKLLKIYEDYGKHNLLTSFLNNIHSLTLLNEIYKAYKTLQEDKNILPLADFNKIISEQIKDEPAPFIYEKMGNRYRHFFIDEFQDTSVLQWQNLIPLIDNAVSAEINSEKGTLLLVGDAKQAIYRWRGGRAEQFINLCNNYNPFSNSDKNVVVLNNNYRSLNNIIDFNNKFFSYLSYVFTNSSYKNLYEEKCYQQLGNKNGGGVKISFINTENLNNDLDEEENLSAKDLNNLAYCEETLKAIKECESLNYQYSDICILTRKKEHGFILANFLTENNIPILSSESLLLSSSKEVQFVINMLLYGKSTANLSAKAKALHYIAQENVNDNEVHDFISSLLNKENSVIENELKKYNYQFSFNVFQKKSLYEIAEIIVNAFLLKKSNTTYVQYFLDLVLEREIKHQNNLSDFITYWQTLGIEKTIPTPEGKNAVKIMTIHKSKGLEFPIVIYPFAQIEFSKEKNDNLWIPLEEESIAINEAWTPFNKSAENFSNTAKEIYLTRKEENQLDIINVLYVCFTRAEEKLYIISKKAFLKDNEIQQGKLSAYFLEFLKADNKDYLNENTFVYGTFDENKSIKKLDKTTEIIEIVEKNNIENNIKISYNEAMLWSSNKLSFISKGNITHKILENIYTLKDIDTAINIATETGIISHNEAPIIKQNIISIVNHKDLSVFYEPNSLIFNEKTILNPLSENAKPDKIVIKDNNAYILDYKTGEKKEKYKQQLLSYENLLKKMNYEVKKKTLVYIGNTIEIINL